MRSTDVRRAIVTVVLAAAAAAAADFSPTLRRAEESIDKGDYAAAITSLERVLPDARGSDDVLVLLRRAYRREIRNLVANGDRKTAQKYLDRLRFLEERPEQGAGSRAPAHPQDAAAHHRDAARPAEPAPDDPPAATAAPRRGDPSGPPVRSAAAAAEPPAAAPSAKLRQAHPADRPAARRGNADPPDSNHLTRADALFRAQRYVEAKELYEEAHRAAPNSLNDATERWAYCRLCAVVNDMNRAPDSAADWARIEAEIRSILEMIPSNEYAHSLLQIAHQRSTRVEPPLPTGPAVIRATEPEASQGKPAGPNLLAGIAARIGLGLGDDAKRALWQRSRSGSWQVLETSNFRVHYSDESIAGQVADVAERTRIELYRTWFGQLPQADWQPKCDIFIHSSAEAYAKVTGQGPASPGHSSTGIDHGRIQSRRVDIRRDGPDVVHAVLPHEITHVVMADRFANRPLPRWADEGMAVLTEPEQKKLAHLRNIERAASRGQLYTARQLMTMADYPEGAMWGTFYAQSVSLVQFLVDRGTPTQFVDFLAGCLQTGHYELELKRVYGYANFGELEREWARGVGEQVASAAAQR